MKKHFFFGAIFLLFLTFPLDAQNTNPTTNQTTTKVSEENSDIAITATVWAKELKFEVVPAPTVEFSGSKPRQTVWEADRANLPNQVEPGVVYRDVGIRLRIFSRFSEIQRIALETPDEENQPAAPTQNQTAPTTGLQPVNQTNQTVKSPVKPRR